MVEHEVCAYGIVRYLPVERTIWTLDLSLI